MSQHCVEQAQTADCSGIPIDNALFMKLRGHTNCERNCFEHNINADDIRFFYK